LQKKLFSILRSDIAMHMPRNTYLTLKSFLATKTLSTPSRPERQKRKLEHYNILKTQFYLFFSV